MNNYKNKKIIFVPIEVKNREFHPKLFFSYYCLKNNFSVFFGNKKSILRAVKNFSPGTYFHKSINVTDINHIINIKDKKNFYVSLDEEGGFAFSNVEDMSKFLDHRSSKKNMKLVDKIFTWGKFDEKIWKKKYLKYSKKIINFGAPRVDLWKEKNVKKIYNDEIEFLNLKYEKGFILILSSGLTSIKELKKVYKYDSHWMKFKNEKQKTMRLKVLKNDLKLFKMFLQTVFEVCKNNPNYNFVIKPHPTESKEDWINFRKKFPKNLFFEDKFETSPLIHCSNMVIQTSSSTALQAFMLKKKIISYRPKNIYFQRDFSNYFGSIAFNSEQVSNLIKSKKNHIKKDKKMYTKLKQRLNFSDKFDNCSKIARFLYAFTPKNKSINLSKVIIYSFIFQVIDFFKSFVLFKSKKVDYSNRSYKEKMQTGIKKIDILKFFSSLNFNKIKVVKICNDGFYLTNK